MFRSLGSSAAVALLFLGGTAAAAQSTSSPGQFEFGMTERELVQSIEKVEMLIAKCMRTQGFEYVAVDVETVRRAMGADKVLPGLEEEEFIAKYGFGLSTLYTGQPPQLATGYSPGKMGMGRRNIEFFKGLSSADQVAYSRALFGTNADATFAIGLDAEDFTRTGGCTREAIEQVFAPEQLQSTYYNPKDALIAADPRMKAALREYQAEMRAAGFDVVDPDKLEETIRERLDAITNGGKIKLEDLSPEQRDALESLQNYERELAAKSFALEVAILEPVELRVERELFARTVQ